MDAKRKALKQAFTTAAAQMLRKSEAAVTRSEVDRIKRIFGYLNKSQRLADLHQAAGESRKRVSKASPQRRKELLARAHEVMRSKIPPWRKPPVDVPVQALREFMSLYGADVSVLVTWTHETNRYQFVTIGSDHLYSHSAVNLRNEIAKILGLDALGPVKEDLRADHPNLQLTPDQINFVLWVLGRLWAEKDDLGKGHKKYIRKHHDKLLKLLGDAKTVLESKPT